MNMSRYSILETYYIIGKSDNDDTSNELSLYRKNDFKDDMLMSSFRLVITFLLAAVTAMFAVIMCTLLEPSSISIILFAIMMFVLIDAVMYFGVTSNKNATDLGEQYNKPLNIDDTQWNNTLIEFFNNDNDKSNVQNYVWLNDKQKKYIDSMIKEDNKVEDNVQTNANTVNNSSLNTQNS